MKGELQTGWLDFSEGIIHSVINVHALLFGTSRTHIAKYYYLVCGHHYRILDTVSPPDCIINGFVRKLMI